MVEISKSGSGEGPGRESSRGYSTRGRGSGCGANAGRAARRGKGPFHLPRMQLLAWELVEELLGSRTQR
jgi:hypothetical protein